VLFIAGFVATSPVTAHGPKPSEVQPYKYGHNRVTKYLKLKTPKTSFLQDDPLLFIIRFPFTQPIPERTPARKQKRVINSVYNFTTHKNACKI
jgi:hypothetical protein